MCWWNSRQETWARSLAPGWWKVFRLYASASATNDLGGVPQLLARLPQLTVLAGQTHRVGPQQAHFREAGAECGAHLLKGKQAESGMEEFLTGRLFFAMFYITVLAPHHPAHTLLTHQNQCTSVKIGHHSCSSAECSSSSPVYLIPFFPPSSFLRLLSPQSEQSRTKWKRHNPERYFRGGRHRIRLFNWPASDLYASERVGGWGGLVEDAAAHSDTGRKSNNLKTAWMKNRWIFWVVK